MKHVGTDGHVITAGRVVPERCSANSGKMVAGGVHEEDPKTDGRVVVGGVVGKRLRPNGHVKVASTVAGKRQSTNPRVITAGSIVTKRTSTHGGIVDPAGEVEQSVIALSGVGAGIASVGPGPDRLRLWQKPETEERECDEKWWSCSFESNQWVHRYFLSFPRGVVSAIAGPEEART